MNINSGKANHEQSDASSSDIRTVARVGQICALFGSHVQELTASDIAARAGLNRTTAYRYCSSMVAAGILERGSKRGRFAPGGLFIELGVRTLGRQKVIEVAAHHLRELRTATRSTAVLSLRGIRGPVVALVEEDTSRMVVLTVHVGTRLDATAAQTHVFLANSDASTFEAFASDLNSGERSRLRSNVTSAQREGYALARQEGGVFAIGAPIYDESGLVATIGVLGVGESRETAKAITALHAAAGALSAELGGEGVDRCR